MIVCFVVCPCFQMNFVALLCWFFLEPHFFVLMPKIKENVQYLIIQKDSGMRPMTVKQAEKWLEKVKTSNQNSFKELSKVLKKYERTSDDYDCFMKMNSLLMDLPELTSQINNYLEEGNKFIVNQSEVDKINELVKYIRKVDINSFQEIAQYITKLHSERRHLPAEEYNDDVQNRLVRTQVLNQVKGKPQLEAYAQKALFLSAEQMLKQLDLSHLKVVKQQEPASKQITEEPAQIVYQVPVQREQPIIEYEKPKTKTFPPFINQNQEKYFFRQFQSNLDSKLFQQIVKIINIYHLGIISRAQALDLLKPHCGNDFAAIKDLIQSRETDRRKNSDFRPLNDMFFINFERATHSYVKMPPLYPSYCSHNNAFLKQILNKKWVSVPTGSQQAFNVRIKNSYEQNLIKAEDDRYEFDIYCKRLEKALDFMDKAVAKLKEKGDADISRQIQKIISLGSIQTLYKNTSKQQREELQFHLRGMKLETLMVFQTRMRSQYTELLEMRSIHGLRTWTQVANKNFQKALDFKGHEFKRTQKMKMKSAVFLEQLKIRINYLNSRGQNKSYDTPFEDRRQFFSILNSFETSSRKQRCISRKLPPLKIYNIKDYKIPTLLPAIIMAFEDDSAMLAVYSFVIYYIDNAVLNESQKIRCKSTFKQIMKRFFKLKDFEVRCLSNSFDEEKFFNQVINGQLIQEKLSDWIHKQIEANEEIALAEDTEKIIQFNSIQDSASEYNFQPPKSADNLVFYAIDNFYVFLRFLYALYERIIRMRQVAENERKARLFEILYFTCIKTKESARFQDSLNNLFGEYAYLFSTFYKLLQSLQKSLNTVSACPFYNQSQKLMNYESQQIYLMLLNRFILNSMTTSSRIMRFTFESNSKILYINSFDSYYKIDDQTKQLQKRRADITSKIEIYTLLKSEEEEKKPFSPIIIKNQMQYCFEGNSIKMLNLSNKQDFMISERKHIKNDAILNEVRKNKKLREKII